VEPNLSAVQRLRRAFTRALESDAVDLRPHGARAGMGRPTASAAHLHRYPRLPGSRWAGTAAAGKPTVSSPHPCRGQPARGRYPLVSFRLSDYYVQMGILLGVPLH
jgi:hypothetical protein